MAPVVLLASPSTVPLTSTLTVHEALCATLPPERLITPVPAVAVTVPLQVLVTFGVLDTTSVALPEPPLTGNVSLKATPVRSPAAVVFGLLMVKVRVEVPFKGMLTEGLNALLIVGGATTVRLAVPVLPVPAVASLTVTLLLAAPATVPCTCKDTPQVTPGARVELARETEPEPDVAVATPLQVLLSPLGVATTKVPGAVGRVSVKVIPVSVWFTFFVLSTLMARLVWALSGM